jgi:two-component system C4-dicarboxylate transport sensor histidine kinase DctB
MESTGVIRPGSHGRIAVIAAILATALLAGAAIWFAGSIAARGAYDLLRSDGRSSAALHTALLRSELEKFRLVPLALADDPQTRSLLVSNDHGFIGAFDERLERLNGNIKSAAIYLIRSDGSTVAASNFKQPLSFVGSNYGFRAYFRQALRTGGFEQFALGTVSRLPGLYIARRVTGGGARGVVVLKVEFDQLEAEWRQSGMPAYVTDPRGIVIITSVPQWRFLTTRPIDPQQRALLRKNLDFGDAALTTLPISAANDPGMVTVSSSGKSEDFVETIVRTSKDGWDLHLLTPVGGRVRDAATTARFATAAVVLLIVLVVGGIIRRRRRRTEQTRKEAADRAALEAEVDARTQDLRYANRKLRREMAERKVGEAKLQQARDQLVQANKLASLGQITAGVAHEINQPVAAIRTYADNGKLLIDQERNADAAHNLDRIVAMTDRIGAITGELRGFARKARGTLSPLVIGEVIDGALLLLGDRIERQQVTVSTSGDAAARVSAERVRLEQVLMNLLVNALDAMEKESGESIRFDIRPAGRWIDVDLHDNGPGLTAEAEANLFKPFSTTKDQGLGLGLTISLEIMRELGGDLSRIPSATGATFRMRLKRA